MKAHLIIIVLCCAYVRSMAQQNPSKWEFSVVIEHGRDYYHRTYYNMDMDALPPGYLATFPSIYSRGIGILAERHLNAPIAIVGQLTYSQKKMPVDIFGEPSGTMPYYSKEIHHRSVIESGIRWYVNPNSRLILFLDAKAGANIWISGVSYSPDQDNKVDRDAYGYDRVTPVCSASAGMKWKWLALSCEYRQDLLAVKRTLSASGIKSRGIVGKVTLSVFKGK